MLSASLLAVPYFWEKLSSFMLPFLYRHQDISAFGQDQLLELDAIAASLCNYEKENACSSLKRGRLSSDLGFQRF